MPHILVIEDSPLQAETLRLTLVAANFTVEVAHHAREGLEKLRRGTFDLILSDVLMPDLSGYELCRLIRRDPQFKNVPIVLLTHLVDPQDVLQGLECGADNFITKPFESTYLIQRIQRILSHRKGAHPSEGGTPAGFRDQGGTVTADKSQLLDLLLATVEEYIHARNREREALASREALIQEAAALSESGRRKDQYLATLAHELRNPLAPMLSSLHILRQKAASAEAREQSLERMERQLRHLSRLLDDLLDASRLSQGKVSLRLERLDLGRVVRTAVEDQRSVLEKTGLTLTVDTPETPVWTQGDATRLNQVLVNLLDNAAKFTDRGGRVHVSLTTNPRSEEAVIRVEDTGIGMEPNLLPQLFVTFSQADRSLDRSRGGLGLGLAVVKGLVELHGGQVEAASPGPGQGSAFTIRLKMDQEPKALTSVPKSPSAGGLRARVLLIEDNPDAANSLSLLLGLLGHEVHVAYSGPEGVEAAASWSPEVVISDIGLPGMDGYEVGRRLRQQENTRSILLIALTGYNSDEDRRLSREAGFDYHLVKPAEPADLQRLLATRVRKHKV